MTCINGTNSLGNKSFGMHKIIGLTIYELQLILLLVVPLIKLVWWWDSGDEILGKQCILGFNSWQNQIFRVSMLKTNWNNSKRGDLIVKLNVQNKYIAIIWCDSTQKVEYCQFKPNKWADQIRSNLCTKYQTECWIFE